MQHTDIITIANAKAALDRIISLNKQFLQHATAHQVPHDIQAALEVTQERIAIDCFGHLATATPRPVRTSNDLYCMEYVFIVQHGDQAVEVTRFYLSEHGQILESPSAQRSVCDFNNAQIARHLCGRALLGTLTSLLLAPAPARR